MAHLAIRAGFSEGFATAKDFRTNVSWGRGRLRSTVELYGVPANALVRRRVRLYRELDGALLREVWSDATSGIYDFQWIDETGIYTVITYDHGDDRRRAAVADGLTLASGAVEMMP